MNDSVGIPEDTKIR